MACAVVALACALAAGEPATPNRCTVVDLSQTDYRRNRPVAAAGTRLHQSTTSRMLLTRAEALKALPLNEAADAGTCRRQGRVGGLWRLDPWR